jgi:hypothetical protein
MLCGNPGPPEDFAPKENHHEENHHRCAAVRRRRTGSTGFEHGHRPRLRPAARPPGDSVSSPKLNPGVIRGFDPQPEPPVRTAIQQHLAG